MYCTYKDGILWHKLGSLLAFLGIGVCGPPGLATVCGLPRDDAEAQAPPCEAAALAGEDALCDVALSRRDIVFVGIVAVRGRVDEAPAGPQEAGIDGLGGLTRRVGAAFALAFVLALRTPAATRRALAANPPLPSPSCAMPTAALPSSRRNLIGTLVNPDHTRCCGTT